MTAKELIEVLEQILEDRDGEDIDVRMDVDFDASYGIVVVSVINNIMDDGEDIVLLQSPESADAFTGKAARYVPRTTVGVPRPNHAQRLSQYECKLEEEQETAR